eukprot:gene21249-22070_t
MSGEATGHAAAIDFVLGGARSGKTRYALDLALASGLAPVYVATATAFDAEMTTRIDRHKAERGPEWSSVEEPLELPRVLSDAARPERILLVDCLTLWLSNLLFAERDIATESARLVETLGRLAGPAILVSNEIGLGIVPDNALSRAFRDHQGLLNQMVAKAATRVTFVAAGLPLRLKG